MRCGEGQRHSAAPPRAAGTGRGVPRPEPRTGAVPGRPSRPPLPGPKPGPSLSQDITAAEKGPAAAAERGSRSALGAHGTAPRGKGCRAFSRESNRTGPDRTGPDRAGPPGYPGPSDSRRAAPQRSPKRIDRGTEEEQTKPPAVPYPPAGAAAGSHSSPSPLPRCRCSPPPPSYTTVAARGTLASLAEAEPPAPPGPSRLRDRALTGNGVLRPRHGSPSAPRPHRGIGLVPRAQRAPAGRSRSPLRRRSQPVPGPGALRSCRGRLHINIPKG